MISCFHRKTAFVPSGFIGAEPRIFAGDEVFVMTGQNINRMAHLHRGERFIFEWALFAFCTVNKRTMLRFLKLCHSRRTRITNPSRSSSYTV
jgi:hypothetical protein